MLNIFPKIIFIFIISISVSTLASKKEFKVVQLPKIDYTTEAMLKIKDASTESEFKDAIKFIQSAIEPAYVVADSYREMRKNHDPLRNKYSFWTEEGYTKFTSNRNANITKTQLKALFDYKLNQLKNSKDSDVAYYCTYEIYGNTNRLAMINEYIKDSIEVYSNKAMTMELVTAVAYVENRYRPKRRSPAGADSLMQITPICLNHFKKWNSFAKYWTMETLKNDWRKSIVVGIWYFDYCLKRANYNEMEAIRMYNYGANSLALEIDDYTYSFRVLEAMFLLRNHNVGIGRTVVVEGTQPIDVIKEMRKRPYLLAAN